MLNPHQQWIQPLFTFFQSFLEMSSSESELTKLANSLAPSYPNLSFFVGKTYDSQNYIHVWKALSKQQPNPKVIFIFRN